MSNEDLRKEQHAKLRALIQPLGDALEVEPADSEIDEEGAIWDTVNDLYSYLTDFFKEAKK